MGIAQKRTQAQREWGRGREREFESVCKSQHTNSQLFLNVEEFQSISSSKLSHDLRPEFECFDVVVYNWRLLLVGLYTVFRTFSGTANSWHGHGIRGRLLIPVPQAPPFVYHSNASRYGN